MSYDSNHLITAQAAAELLGVSTLYVRILAKAGLLPARAIGERQGCWTGENATSTRATIWLVDPRPEGRNWRSYSEAAEALGLDRKAVRALVRAGKLEAIETGDPRLKVITLASIEQVLAERNESA